MDDNLLYLSDQENVDVVLELSGLAPDELEEIVGRFNKNSQWAGSLRGAAKLTLDGEVTIVHHFTKEILWRS